MSRDSGRGPPNSLRPASLRRVPWETLLLLGGGFAMAAGVQGSGLSQWLARQLLAARELPPGAQVLLASVVTVGVSAIASNTATIAIMLVVVFASRLATVPSLAWLAPVGRLAWPWYVPLGTALTLGVGIASSMIGARERTAR